jgi:hypothetical protein
MITFCYDKTKGKVGCVLLQAAYGCNIDGFNLQKFGIENWLLAPTNDLKVYCVQDQPELDKVIASLTVSN